MIEQLSLDAFNIKVHDTKEKAFNFLGTKPAVIDFYADWCAPCKAMHPVLSKLSEEFEGVDFYKVNVDSEPQLSSMFNIRSIPTVVYIPFDSSKAKLVKVGAMSEDVIRSFVKEIL